MLSMLAHALPDHWQPACVSLYIALACQCAACLHVRCPERKSVPLPCAGSQLELRREVGWWHERRLAEQLSEALQASNCSARGTFARHLSQTALWVCTLTPTSQSLEQRPPSHFARPLAHKLDRTVSTFNSFKNSERARRNEGLS